MQERRNRGEGNTEAPNFLKGAKMPFLVLRSALFVTKSAIFVQDNVAVYTNLRSKVPFLSPKAIANLRRPNNALLH